MKKAGTLILFTILTVFALAHPIRAEAATLSSKAGAVTTRSGPLNVRATASASATVLTTLRKGSYITLISQTGDWWLVEYAAGKQGYCHKAYITIVEGTPVSVATNTGALNVRSGPGTSYPKITSLPKGQTVILLTSSGGWSRILYHGIKTGYVSAQYLSGAASGSPAVLLHVPNYKQTDARWANVKLGTSGKTIDKIGCATTAIAMMESYRTGTTIYPDAMAKKLRYTSTGSVYWPDNLVPVTNSSGYLANLYQLLKQGKPVLLGAKNASGGQHWVVVTGFNGGSLTASNFAISDPGSHSRVNLQQFLNAYPNFYKYFYYK